MEEEIRLSHDGRIMVNRIDSKPLMICEHANICRSFTCSRYLSHQQRAHCLGSPVYCSKVAREIRCFQEIIVVKCEIEQLAMYYK